MTRHRTATMLPETWSDVEVWWTMLAVVMLPPALYGLGGAIGDVRAAYAKSKPLAIVLAAWWWFSAALLFVLLFGGFAALGFIAGAQPPRPVTVGGVETASSTLSAAVLFVVGGAAAVCLLLGLWIRQRIYVLPLETEG
jgi:hypothetical protein